MWNIGSNIVYFLAYLVHYHGMITRDNVLARYVMTN